MRKPTTVDLPRLKSRLELFIIFEVESKNVNEAKLRYFP